MSSPQWPTRNLGIFNKVNCLVRVGQQLVLGQWFRAPWLPLFTTNGFKRAKNTKPFPTETPAWCAISVTRRVISRLYSYDAGVAASASSEPSIITEVNPGWMAYSCAASLFPWSCASKLEYADTFQPTLLPLPVASHRQHNSHRDLPE